ncbi:urea transporter [Arthrobacter sp. GCM10027362]|uniref:urea transporter n=1 Tax=Arthrobacter sp. GCM10027362 TaxID=3273379 RepID=UPI0036314B63
MIDSVTARSAVGNLRSCASILGRGISQIYFQSNIWCGLLILAAFATADWRMAVLVLLVLLGAASSTVAGVLLRLRWDEINVGFHGFCGALVGAASFAALGAGWAGVAATVAGGAACSPVAVGVARLFSIPGLKQFNLPVTTAPFCIVAGLIYWLTTPLRPGAALPAPTDATVLQGFGRSLLTNVSQVVLVDSAVAGALILLGLFIASWKVGVAALFGSALESLVALVTGQELDSLYHGLLGYCGVLTAIALAVIFLKGTWQPWVAAVVGVVLSTPLAYLLHATAIPVYTWPYILATWMVLVAVKFIPGFRRR